MRTLIICTDNAIKFAEMADMARLYGLAVRQAPGDTLASSQTLGELGELDAVLREQTQLLNLPDSLVEHTSTLTVTTFEQSPQQWIGSRVKGILNDNAAADDTAYNWDTRFCPVALPFPCTN